MFRKIIEINNIGKFKDFKSVGDVSFRKINLIYAANGQGKTTLCAILRSLQTGEALLIQERKTLGFDGQKQSVKIKTDDKIIEFSMDKWQSEYPDIAIFDERFVCENIYLGDSIENDQRRSLYNVIIGKQGVELAKEIERLNSLINDNNKVIRDSRKIIEPVLVGGMDINMFLELEQDNNIEEKIRKKTDEITKMNLALAQRKEILGKNMLRVISLPKLPGSFFQLIDCTLENVVADAEKRVRQHIIDNGMDAHGEAWLSRGMSYTTSNHCPYCSQNIQENDLIFAYRSYFNKSYAELKENVARLHHDVTNTIGDAPLAERQVIISENIALAEYWKRFIDIVLPEIDFVEIQEAYKDFHDASIALAKQKEKSPTNQIIIDETFKSLMDRIDKLADAINFYNGKLILCNILIEAKKKEFDQAVSVEHLKNELNKFEVQRKRYESAVVVACNQYKSASKTKQENERLKDKARNDLDSYCMGIFFKYQSQVNEYLELFNTGFRLDKTKYDYIGQTPRALFQVKINDVNVDLAAKSSTAKPAFKTALSSGDRSAMALAFFLALLRDKSTKQKIVIFDDPFNSQDNFRRTCTQQKISQVATFAKQVIVLSHDPQFLKMIKDDSGDADLKSLRLFCEDSKICLSMCDIDEEVRSVFYKNFYKLREYSLKQKGTLSDIACSIRPFLEGWLRNHYPGQFQDNEWLGDFIGKIRTATDDDVLGHLKPKIEELSDINNYSKKFHHSPSDPIDKNELLGYVNRTLCVTGNKMPSMGGHGQPWAS
ncbi:MAG: AAA family ATPase [Magnetococcus sp. YQC-3]